MSKAVCSKTILSVQRWCLKHQIEDQTLNCKQRDKNTSLKEILCEENNMFPPLGYLLIKDQKGHKKKIRVFSIDVSKLPV